ncbi:hypothetical protein F5Y09DRAFT_326816 [Xylaria sp. FL1042]|nr:hypothetical protein F5Y09DRAFT_326816 [Xylaria sp. FL1042]
MHAQLSGVVDWTNTVIRCASQQSLIERVFWNSSDYVSLSFLFLSLSLSVSPVFGVSIFVVFRKTSERRPHDRLYCALTTSMSAIPVSHTPMA